MKAPSEELPLSEIENWSKLFSEKGAEYGKNQTSKNDQATVRTYEFAGMSQLPKDRPRVKRLRFPRAILSYPLVTGSSSTNIMENPMNRVSCRVSMR